MKRFIKIFVVLGIILSILVLCFSCLPTQLPTGTASTDLSSIVVNLALKQIGKKQGIGDFQGLTWADNEWTYCEVFVSAILTKAVGKSPLTQRPIFGDLAIDDYEAHIEAIKKGDPPKGAIVYYGQTPTNKNCGHVGIADGEGKLISVYTVTNGVTDDDLNSMGAPILGWIYPSEYFSANSVGNTIQYGQEVTGNVFSPGDYQDWKFTGQAGDIITIRMLQNGGSSLLPAMNLLDPYGAQVAYFQNSWVAGGGYSEARIQNYPLFFSGTYTIHTYGGSDAGNTTTGGYLLTLARKPPPGSIKYGQQVTASIALSDDYQDWKFTGQAGDIITIRMLQNGGSSLLPAMKLLDPSGAQVTIFQNSWVAGGGYSEARIQNFTLVSSGTYTIHVYGGSDAGNTTTGGYLLTLTRKPPPGSITYGQQVTGSIALSDDYQDWKFTGQAGDIITIRMLQNGGSSLLPAMNLLDPYGAQVAYFQNSWVAGGGYSEARIQNFTLVSSGTYTIHAYGGSDAGNTTTGGYQLLLNKN